MLTKAQNTSISEAARFYGTTRVTVRKWLKRYKKYGLDGLRDLKRVPKHIPHKLKPEDEAKIIELRQKHPSYFNYIRKNRYRDNKSPLEILRERFLKIDEGVLNLPPIRLESLLELCYKEKDKGGYDVPISVHSLSDLN
jgi:transposase